MKPMNWYGESIKATPLHYCDTLEEALVYFDAGLKGDEPCEGINPLLHSVENFEIFEECLKRGANPNVGMPKMAPLHCQTEAAFIELLIKYGADVNAIDHFGRSPLHCCTNIVALKLLINAGSNTDVKDEDGELPEDGFLEDEEGLEMIRLVQNTRQAKSK
ncbi:hypothetical protein J8M20_04285 [Pseudoalteromonas luteoviolacea]|uniref:ankyrin repeat domain-containing protein n=1 Tax=Pseudoalteromonas luteoviolacea TaxID=43657 RepID=UPI001B378FE1|nr:hypothetical protein [Pseudoalteromonas luteoviolacea]MBQ4810537.1 hypothetical protein [Pseudoalteromonas luteoviolacea]